MSSFRNFQPLIKAEANWERVEIPNLKCSNANIKEASLDEIQSLKRGENVYGEHCDLRMSHDFSDHTTLNSSATSGD